MKTWRRGTWGILLNKPDLNDKYFSLVLLFGQLVISYIKYFYQRGIRRKNLGTTTSICSMFLECGQEEVVGYIRNIHSINPGDFLRGPRPIHKCLKKKDMSERPYFCQSLALSPSLNPDPGRSAFTIRKSIQLVLRGNRLLVFRSSRKLCQQRRLSIDIPVCPLQENRVEYP